MKVRIMYQYDTATQAFEVVNNATSEPADAVVFINDDGFSPEVKIGSVIRSTDRRHFNWTLTDGHKESLISIARVGQKLASAHE
jgi:hypothetical protein